MAIRNFLRGLRRGWILLNKRPITCVEVVERERRRGVTIGEGTKIFGVVDGVNPHLVTIGRYCILGVHASVLTHGPLKGSGRVVIGDFVWIAYNACILPGVQVGHHSIIGTSAVVTRSVPSGSIVAGNPARVLRTLTDAEQEQLEQELRGERTVGYVDPGVDPSTLRVR